MTLAALERVGDAEEVVDGGGLLGGLTAWHIRMLCESEWNGGAGCTPAEVGRMSLDQIWFRLCDAEVLKRGTGGAATEKIRPLEATGRAAGDGLIRGRAADGTPIRGRVRGKSVARELMERQEAERRREKRRKRRKKKG